MARLGSGVVEMNDEVFGNLYGEADGEEHNRGAAQYQNHERSIVQHFPEWVQEFWKWKFVQDGGSLK